MDVSEELLERIRDRIRRFRRCAIYTRQSRGSHKVLTSCDAQYQICRDFSEARDWRILDERYDDTSESSETLDRPALQRLLADIELGMLDVVVVYRLDGLTRRLADFAELMQSLQQHDVEIEVVTDANITSAANASLLANLAITFAEFEQTMTRERMAESRAALKQHGRRVAGIVPYGYNANAKTKQLVVAPREANRVRKMFAWAADGKTPREIAETVNKNGWRTKKRTSQQGRVTGGGLWTPRQDLATLSNPAYVGQILDGDRTRPGAHEAIIDQDLFGRCCSD